MPLQLTNKDTLINLLRKHRLHTIKHFGQHFLINQEALDLIVQSANIQPTDRILEIGAGTGVLTQELAAKAKSVDTYEIDRQLAYLLRDTLGSFTNINLHLEDFRSVADLPLEPYKLVANLPYNAATHILDQLISLSPPAGEPPTSISVLIQREVAEKIAAVPPHATYLSNFTQTYGQASIIKLVKPGSFFPAPKVDSAILHIEQHKRPLPIKDLHRFKKFLHRGFSQPRKMLNKAFPLSQLQAADIGPNLRPENLSLQDWLNLYKIINEGK